MSLRVVAAVVFSAAILSAGCPSEPNACTPGQSVACTCAGGSMSAQVCRADGSGFEACQCAGSPDASVDATTRDGGTPERDAGIDGGAVVIADTGGVVSEDTGVDTGGVVADDGGIDGGMSAVSDGGIDAASGDAGSVVMLADASEPDARTVIVLLDASVARDAFRRPDTNPPAVCSTYPGVTATLVPAIPATCTPRCASATLDAVNLCTETSPPSCLSTAIAADTTPTISMPIGTTAIDLDCGTCFDINRFHCFSRVCMTQAPAYFLCDAATDADMCGGELAALQTCLDGIPIGSSRETTLNECFATEVTACFDVGGGFAPGARTLRPTRSVRAPSSNLAPLR